MELKYRLKRALRDIECELQFNEKQLCDEAISHMGKELNTAKAWDLKGTVEGLRKSLEILKRNDAYYYPAIK